MLKLTFPATAILAVAFTLPACGQPPPPTTAATTVKSEVVYSAAISVDGRWTKLPAIYADNQKPAKATQADPGSPADANFELSVTPEILTSGEIRSAVSFKWIENGVTFDTKFNVTTASGVSAGASEFSASHEFTFEIRATRR